MSKLFMLDINETTSNQVQSPIFTHLTPFKENSIYKCNTKENLAIFLHQCCLCPPERTWIAAIKRNLFATWPGLTVELINKYLPDSKETAKGHMRQSKKIQGPSKSKHQHRPRHKLHSSLMTRTTQKRHRLLLFHKVNTHGDQPQSAKQRHYLVSFHKANVYGITYYNYHPSNIFIHRSK